MEYYLDDYGSLYYRINENFLWRPFPKEEIERMMSEERHAAMTTIDTMMGLRMKISSPDYIELMNEHYFMIDDVSKWYDGWNIVSYTERVFRLLTGMM